MTQQVLIRADASTTLGAGHVMRCLVLAGRLRALGVASRFVCRAGPGDLSDAVRAAGHALTVLPPDDGAGERNAIDAAECLAALAPVATGRWAWVVADHYRLDARWERTLRAATGARMLAIDGQADRPHDADLLLDPAGWPGSEARWDALLPPHCRRLIGPRHALLRNEFHAAQRLPAAADGERLRIVIAFGGMDAPDATGRVLDALTAAPVPDLAIDAIVGAGCPHIAAHAARAAHDARIALHRQPPAVAALMRRAHLAVCAGGGTLIELCALQVPALVVTIAANQRAGTAALQRAGCALDLGPLERFDAGALRAALAHVSQPPVRQAMRAAQHALMAPPEHDVAQWMIEAFNAEAAAE